MSLICHLQPHPTANTSQNALVPQYKQTAEGLNRRLTLTAKRWVYQPKPSQSFIYPLPCTNVNCPLEGSAAGSINLNNVRNRPPFGVNCGSRGLQSVDMPQRVLPFPVIRFRRLGGISQCFRRFTQLSTFRHPVCKGRLFGNPTRQSCSSGKFCR